MKNSMFEKRSAECGITEQIEIYARYLDLLDDHMEKIAV